MASGTASVKIVIAGAGVAGLSLAAMLEKVGVDYVILEGHGAVAPPVGASIGLFPNGLRLLDQVGCSEPLMKLGDPSPGTFFIRDEEGKPLLRTPSCYPHSKIRYVSRSNNHMERSLLTDSSAKLWIQDYFFRPSVAPAEHIRPTAVQRPRPG